MKAVIIISESFHTDPVKNVMRILISCHKSTVVWFKLTPKSMAIPCHLSWFYLFSMLEHDMDFGQVQVMEFPWHLPRKWWGFLSDLVSFSTKLPSRIHEKIHVTFFIGEEWILKYWLLHRRSRKNIYLYMLYTEYKEKGMKIGWQYLWNFINIHTYRNDF